jgi:nicotinamide-nucleotide amidase
MSDDATTNVQQQIADSGVSIAVAESLTGGLLSNRFAKIPGAGSFFRGGVVAYAASTKFSVLGVRPGPVITQDTAEEMAIGVRRLLDADIGVGITGVGGPGPEEDEPAGTVFVAVALKDAIVSRKFSFGEREPLAICHAACDATLALTAELISQRAESLDRR